MVLLAVGADVLGVQALRARQLVVELDGAALPLARERVDEGELELGAVERAFARLDLVVHAGRLAGRGERGLGVLPGGHVADVVLGHGGELDEQVLVEAEVGVDVLQEPAELRHLRLDLILGAEDVRVVLHEAADAHDAVQGAARLVARAVAELGKAERQVLVAPGAALEDLDRAGAVHRLHREEPLLALGDEHVLLVVRPVAAALPEAARHDRRRVHLLVAVLDELAAHVVLERDVDGPPARMPEDLAGILGVKVEEVQLHAEAPVVAALRLLGARDDLVQLRLVLRDDAVDALEHLVLLVAAVVAAGDAGELDDADLLRVRDVRTAAHLHVVADGVGRDVLALGDVAEALELVLLAREHLRALVARDDLPDERLVERDEARDLSLDLREVLRRKAVRQVEVVVEPLVRRRADVDLHVLEHVLHRARHQVRRGMPPHLKCSFCHCLSLNKSL